MNRPPSPLTMLLSRHTRRREFIAGLGSAAAWGLPAWAQQQTPVIGFLDWESRQPETGPVLTGFRQGLAAHGYIENHNVAIEFREANGQFTRVPALAAELVRRRVSVMVVINARNSVFEAKRATSEIPIVFVYGGDPVRDGIVASLNRPGNNVTGITLFNSELGGKRLSLLLSLVPQAKTIAFLKVVDSNIQQPDQQDEQLVALARTVGREVIILTTRGDAYEDAFKALVENPADALIIGNFTFRNRSKIMALAERYKMPAIYPSRNYAVNGGLMSYGAALPDVFRLLGNYTGRILKGEKPADLPVQQPTKFEFVINLKTAKALGLTIPPSILAIADEVIEYPRYGRLGVRFRQITQEMAADLRLQSTRGVIVTDVDDTGAAKPAGIQAGDVIMRMGGKEILELRDLPRIVAETPANKVVEVVIIRDGVERSINVTLGPEIPLRAR